MVPTDWAHAGSIALPIVALGLIFATIVILLLVIWSIKRHRDPDLHIECDSPIDKLMPSLAGLSLGSVVEGNAVEVFENGAYFDALVEEMREAKETVHFETYLWKEGTLGQRIADALSERARAGLKVRVLLDATGTKKMGRAAERQMKDAGCKVVKFHHRHLRNIGVMNERDHRKLVVLDGRVAFLGGHCITDDWLGNAEDKKHFADVSVKVRGPIVNAVQSAFSENWAGETGELFVGDAFFPRLHKVGDITAHAAYTKPENSAPAVKILHHTALCLARRKIWIQNPYFIPKQEAIAAFGTAVKRGVDVRVLMPSTSGSDSPLVQHAGHYHFEQLLKLGVRLFEYPHTLLHQKVMTIDGCWSAVGSTNFDDRSFDTNDEVTVGILDEGITAQLDAIFEKYCRRAEEIKLEKWRKRSVFIKVKDNAAYLLNDLL